MKEILLLNPENVSDKEVSTYEIRESSRAVVIDGDGLIALLHVSKDGYYKLPGGGFEGSENPLMALARECKEEIGCEVAVVNEIGVVTEYRKKFNLKQISYCYIAKVVGEKRPPEFDAGEREHGFAVAWLKYNEVVEALEKSDIQSYEGGLYIVPRDKAILEEAATYLKTLGIQ
ncbi:MAG: NUDIX domain-containing protein [bacterium]|nr:NUDIX domain-containing protein [bacterium]